MIKKNRPIPIMLNQKNLYENYKSDSGQTGPNRIKRSLQKKLDNDDLSCKS